MKKDPIIAELRRTRDRIAAEFNCDVRALFAHYKQMERESGATCVHRGPKLVKRPALKSK